MSLKNKCKDSSDLESPLGESKLATVTSGLFIHYISCETDFSLERDRKGKIADFRKTTLLGFVANLCVSVTPRAINILFAPLGSSKRW